MIFPCCSYVISVQSCIWYASGGYEVSREFQNKIGNLVYAKEVHETKDSRAIPNYDEGDVFQQ